MRFGYARRGAAQRDFTRTGRRTRREPLLGAAAHTLLALLALAARALAGGAALRRASACLLAQILEQPAAEQHLALLLGEVVAEGELVAGILDASSDLL